jgi:tetratricopeptide (TPR) repeat protein
MIEMHIRNALVLSLFSVIGICQSQAVYAQEADESALDEGAPKAAPVVLAAPGALELQSAMRRIALRPTDADALSDAGNASLLLGDPNAALNFYTRANAVQPSSGKIKAGLAAATVRTENPFEALRLFDEAIRLGISERAIAADRALAFDLLGNFDRAQLDYKLASTAFVSDDLIIQQAISLSLLGRREEADGMLVPLLKKENPSAWRARAFMLAARGELTESERVAQSFLDLESARRVERYLRMMPQLTDAQQAAAIHLGHFPANNIGRDSDAVRTVASTIPPVPKTGPGRLIPSGTPLGTKTVSGKPVKESTKARKEREKAEKLAAAVVKPTAVLPTANAAAAVPLPNAIAKARIEEAARASVTLTAMRDLPPPDTARPMVKVVLPSQSDAIPAIIPPKVAVSAPSPVLSPVIAPTPVPAVLQPVIPVPAPITPTVIVQSQPAASPQPVIAAPITPILPQPIVTPAPTQPSVAQPLTLPLPQPLPLPIPTPIAVVSSEAVQTAPKVISSAIELPSPAIVTNPTPATAPVSMPSVSLPSTTTPAPAPDAPVVPAIQNGPMPDGTIVKDAPDIVFVSNVAPVVASVDVPSLPQPATLPQRAAPKSFDLGSIVNAIEIPESEQRRNTAAVDLKKLKPVAPKMTAEETKAAAAKAKLSTKTPASPARFWVQIATGDKSAVGYDYRNWSKKKPDLFKGLSGWSSPWNKTSRLLVGPFPDLKASKKFEADFRKAGGNGFAWKSEEGTVVEPVKGK